MNQVEYLNHVLVLTEEAMGLDRECYIPYG